MGDLLISGPAGAGKTQAAREELDNGPLAIAADFQSVLAALTLLERGPDGRYPARTPRQEQLLPLAEYVRRAAITAARQREIRVVMTNSDGDPARREYLLGLLAGGSEIIIDPGKDVVTSRLIEANGFLSDQCNQAIERWYSRRR